MRYPLAEWRPSPNKSKRAAPVSLVVIHQTDGGPNAEHAVEHLRKPLAAVSAHFLVARDGAVFQLVDVDEVAWHDKGRNGISVGIEHVARTPGEFKNWQDLRSSQRAALVDAGADSECPADPGMPLTEAQLAASARLVAWLLAQLNLKIDAVVPHCSNAESTHRDCGRDASVGGIWNWADYRRQINEAIVEKIG